MRFKVISILAGLALLAGFVYAQGQPDFSKVQIKTTKLSDNFYTLEGQGGKVGLPPVQCQLARLQTAHVEQFVYHAAHPFGVVEDPLQHPDLVVVGEIRPVP